MLELNQNRKAFLTMIAVSEGTPRFGNQDGYDVIVGGETFDDYSDHPRTLVKLNKRLSSTAAGRYQILERIFDHYKKQLGLKDFSPESQDQIALQLIKECRAMGDIDAGRFPMAVKKCKSRWASLPGSGYGQHENTLAALQEAYLNAGGIVA